MKAAIVNAMILTGSVSLAAPPPEPRPLPSPPPARPAPLPPQPGVWQQIQDPLDRSTGRIVDESLYQVDRLGRLQDERLGRIPTQREFELLQEERERWLRFDNRATREQIEAALVQKATSDRKVYDRLHRAGFSPVASQAMVDEQAMREARSHRDRQLEQANQARDAAMQLPSVDAARIRSEHDRKVREINEQFDARRSRILGFAPAPATQPES